MSNRDLALAMVVLTHAKQQIAAALKECRDKANAELVAKENVAAIAPDGSVLGNITRTSKDPVARVEDLAALMAYLQEEGPESLFDADILRGGVTDEQVFAVLREHAPHLVDSEVRIHEYVLNALLKRATEKGAVPPPGVVVERGKAGTTNVYPAKDQAEAIEALITSGRVLLDGTVREIEGGA